MVGLLFGVVANAQVQALSEAEKKEEEEAFKIKKIMEVDTVKGSQFDPSLINQAERSLIDNQIKKLQNDEIDRNISEPRISNEYFQGQYLIYDCRQRHYVCVNSASFDKCRGRRDEALDERRFLLPCAPLLEFKSQKECFQEHYKQVHQLGNRKFCVNRSTYRL